MLYNIDPGCPYDYFEKSSKKFENHTTFKNAGIRFNEMKLLLGNPGKPDGWIPPPPEVVDLPEPEKEFNSIVNHFFRQMICFVNLSKKKNLIFDFSI